MASATRRRRRSLVLLAAVVITVMMLPASPATAWPTNPTCTQYNEGQVIRLQYEDTWVEYECREVLQPDYTFGFQWVVRDVGNVRDEDGTHLSDWEDAAYVALLQGFTGKSAGGGIFGVHYSLRTPGGTNMPRTLAVRLLVQRQLSSTSWETCGDSGWVQSRTATWQHFYIRNYVRTPKCGSGNYRARIGGRFLSVSTGNWVTHAWKNVPGVRLQLN